MVGRQLLIGYPSELELATYSTYLTSLRDPPPAMEVHHMRGKKKTHANY